MLTLLLTLTAFGQEATNSTAYVPRPLAGRPVLDLRVGVDTAASLDTPQVCMEGYPLAWWTIEACGNGSGIWHNNPQATDIAHFRTRIRALHAQNGRTEAEILPGIGFTEIQVGEDRAGFLFGEARSEDQVEAAGAEASVSGKVRIWLERTYLVVDVNAGAAIIPAQPVVTGATGPVLGFGAVTVGAGF
ncbi:MAG: hypothetical protein EP330_16370 [Deltaproteobacteria bacterium]|nr:MAG: hypothetical protein EP330_16370 [Deltaproteobacteria bacterium]